MRAWRAVSLATAVVWFGCTGDTPNGGTGGGGGSSGPDTTAPVLADLTVTPAHARAGATVTVRVTANEPLGAATLTVGGRDGECAAPAGATVTCTLTAQGSEAEGEAAVALTASDAAGNAATATGTLRFDFTPPSVVLDGFPDNGASSRTLRFSATEAGGSFECRVDTAPFTACASPLALTNLADGARVVEIAAFDLAGNRSADTAKAELFVDATPPVVTFENPPAAFSNVATPTIAFSANEQPVTFDCSFNGSPLASCTSPRQLTLTEGRHAFVVRGTDRFGNRSGLLIHSWEVDLTAPTTQVTMAPPATTGQDTVTVAFTANEPGASFECRLDQGAFMPCSSPASFGPLALGAHAVTVRAVDAAGNAEATGASVTFTVVDLTPPTLTITSKPTPLVASTSATFTFTSSEAPATFECALDSAALAPCAATTTLTVAEGPHTLRVRALDASGNASPETSYSWTVDLTAPTVSLDNPPAFTNANASFAFTSNEAGVTFECALGAAAFAPCTSPARVTPVEGQQVFRVRATDGAGNVSPVASHTFTADVTPPGVPSLEQPTPSWTNNSTPTITWGAATGAASYHLQLSTAADFSTLAREATAMTDEFWVPTPALRSALYYLRVRATDAAGNVSAWSPTAQLQVHTWEQVRQSPQLIGAGSAACASATKCFVAGQATFVRTLDGAQTFSRSAFASGPGGRIATAGAGVVVAASNSSALDAPMLQRSTDDGLTFWPVPLPAAATTPFLVQSLVFSGDTGLLLATSKLYRSTDSGATWTQLTPPSTNFVRAAFRGAPGRLILARGGEAALSNDGGATWQTVTLPVNANPLHVAFTTQDLGFISGSTGMVLKTADGGLTWTALNLATTEPVRVALFTTPLLGVAMTQGAGPNLRYTTDGGATWQTAQRPGAMDFWTDLVMLPAGFGLLLSSSSALLTTTDHGATWSFPAGVSNMVDRDGNAHIIRRLARGTGSIHAVGAAPVLWQSADEGQTWTTTAAAGLPADATLNDASFYGAQGGWVVGHTPGGSPTRPLIARTTDSGASFTVTNWASLPASLTSVNGVHFLDATTGVVVGDGATVLRYNAGTGAFVAQGLVDEQNNPPPTSLRMNAVHLLSAQQGFAVGSGGNVVRFDSTANLWRRDGVDGVTAELLAVHALSADTVVAVGAGGTILRRTAAGWSTIALPAGPYPATTQLTSVRFVDANTGWIVGQSGLILRSDDGGRTWAFQGLPSRSALNTVLPLSLTTVLTGSASAYGLFRNVVGGW